MTQITKSGSQELRRILVEASWHYCKRSAGDLIMTRRCMGQNPEVVAIAIKAQQRLSKKFWKIASSKHQCQAATAIAREFCGSLWSPLNVIENQARQPFRTGVEAREKGDPHFKYSETKSRCQTEADLDGEYGVR